MIREKIEALEELETKYNEKEKELFSLCNSVLEKIYNLQTEYNKNNNRNFFLVERGFWGFKTDNCEILRLEGDTIFINWDDYRYDIKLPIEIFDDDTKLYEWFKSKVSKYEERIKKAEENREEEEYKEYLKLKKKYETV